MIILLGSNGYVGSAFSKYLSTKRLEVKRICRFCYYDEQELTHILKLKQPEFLINCAGYTGKPNVDACEDNKTSCLHANAVLPGIIARACAVANVPWGHISSGCVYQGKRYGAGWEENDPPNLCFTSPLKSSFYSGSKALGEELVANANSQCYIWRLRIPFNEVDSDRNYISKILRYDKLLDVQNSLCHLDEFVKACWQCWTIKAPFGIYHMTNGGSISTREIAEMTVHFGLTDKKFTYFEDCNDFTKTVRTPRSSCVLSNAKALSAGISLRPVREALGNSMRDWNEKAC